jgi:hypothetical protein
MSGSWMVGQCSTSLKSLRINFSLKVGNEFFGSVDLALDLPAPRNRLIDLTHFAHSDSPYPASSSRYDERATD